MSDPGSLKILLPECRVGGRVIGVVRVLKPIDLDLHPGEPSLDPADIGAVSDILEPGCSSANTLI
jgi:hypothetical protein